MEGSDANGAADDTGDDDEVVTQQTFTWPTYRNAPRRREDGTPREDNVSVFRGQVSARDATAYIRAARNQPPEPREREKPRIRVRRLSARKLRDAGFVIDSRAGRVLYPEHCGVFWPADGPPNPIWPPEVQDAFDACSTGKEEGWEE